MTGLGRICCCLCAWAFTDTLSAKFKVYDSNESENSDSEGEERRLIICKSILGNISIKVAGAQIDNGA